MESARSYQATKAIYRRFLLTEYQETSLTNSDSALSGETTEGESAESASGKNQYTLEDLQNSLGLSKGRVNLRTANSSNMVDNLRQVTVRYIFNLLFADRRGKLSDWLQEHGLTTGSSTSQSSLTQTSGSDVLQNFAATNTTVRIFDYSQQTHQFEQEDTSFSTVGTVRTSDGREISFNVDVSMSRQFQQTFKEDLQIASVKMCDPLVINLDTDVAQLSDQKFYFDIDADGEMDEISQLDGRSGYLALDQNGDGVINDGSELFGTASGDGFADLAQYDEDGNGWIDENDAVWSKLQIWCKDENGQDVLYRLADKGVGAICLQKASTDFTLQGAEGQTNGAIRSTGIFLYENGNVGTVQHVDVAKYEQGA
jgi:hypothetical protein